jgi:hypothetical protein
MEQFLQTRTTKPIETTKSYPNNNQERFQNYLQNQHIVFKTPILCFLSQDAGESG